MEYQDYHKCTSVCCTRNKQKKKIGFMAASCHLTRSCSFSIFDVSCCRLSLTAASCLTRSCSVSRALAVWDQKASSNPTSESRYALLHDKRFK